MSATVKIGNSEVVHSGSYIIPLSTPMISLFIGEANYTFKISFEPANIIEDEIPKRLIVQNSDSQHADVIIYYREGEMSFGSTRRPNNLFYTLSKNKSADFHVKTQYQYAFSVEMKKTNSILLFVQITKYSENFIPKEE